MKKKLLVTGAGGYIGSVTTSLFLEAGYQIVALDNFSTGFRAPLDLLQKKYGQDQLHIYETDLKDDLSSVFAQEPNIEIVVHFAGSWSVNESMSNPQKYFSNNVVNTQNLLKTMLEKGIKKIVFSSTCATYGDAKYTPIDEKHPQNPVNPYGASKRIVEQLIEWYHKTVGLDYVLLRYFNVCGATDDGEIGDSKRPSAHLMQNAVKGALNLEPFFLTYPTVNTPDKSPIRDYVNVVDLGNAHLKAVELLTKDDVGEVFNVGTGTGNSVMEVVKKVEEITSKKLNAKTGETRKGEDAILIASTVKAKEVLGWEPTHSIEDSVKTLVDWYTKHPKGWEN